jgi:hypothetical protein
MVYMGYFELFKQSIFATNIIVADTGSMLNYIAETLIKTVLFILLGYVVLKAVLKMLKSHAVSAAEAIGANKLAEKAFLPAESLAELPVKTARMSYEKYRDNKQKKQQEKQRAKYASAQQHEQQQKAKDIPTYQKHNYKHGNNYNPNEFGDIGTTLQRLGVNTNALDIDKRATLSKAVRVGYSTAVAEAMTGVPLNEAAIKQMTAEQKQQIANEIIKQGEVWSKTADLRAAIKNDKDLAKIKWLSNDVEIAKTIRGITQRGGNMPTAMNYLIEELKKNKNLQTLERDVVLNQLFKGI